MKNQDNDPLLYNLMNVVQNQIRDNNPPETKQTLQRLLTSGISDEEARKLICAVLLTEMNEMMKNKETYNEKRYITRLRNLPKLP